MASLDALPPDQRAVLALVLQRGRSYDDIAGLLSIDRAAVRDRALGALDALGPTTRVPPARRALITDYLLGQLPERVREMTRESLANSASERAWARVLAGELAPLATKPLPDIPSGQAVTEPRVADRAAATTAAPAPTPGPAPEAATRVRTTKAAEATQQRAPALSRRETVPAQRPSSRRGGAILLVVGALIVVVVVIIVLAGSGSSPKRTTTKATGTTPTTTTGTTTTTTTTTTSTKPVIIGQVQLRPTSRGSKAVGIGDIVTEGKITALIVAAAHMSPNTGHNAYAIWLYTPGGAAHLLGYVSPGVGKNGQLKTTGQLPANAASYKDLLVTLETTTNTKAPGPVVLAGPLGLTG